MAEKEATVYIVDVGKSMGEKRNGRSMTDLEWAMQYVWDCITATVATGRKTATIGVIGLKTDETSNELDDDPHFKHISVFTEIQQFLMPDIRRLGALVKPSETDKGDAISAIILAIQMIVTYCKKLKYKRKIVLVTNGQGWMSNEDLDQITKKIKEDNIDLVVLGTDFDDPEYGFKEEGKDPRKAENEALLRGLVEDCNGAFGTLEQAVSEMDIPRAKRVRTVATFKGFLQLGNPEEYDTALRIPVERYYRTYVAKPPSASSFVLRSDVGAEGEQGESSQLPKSPPEGGALTSVRNLRTYEVPDENAPGGKFDVEREELAKGYEYGRTAVHISETDENITTLETYAALELVGFIQTDKYDRYMHMSTTNIIIGQRGNDKASLALSSFIHALFELECYAVARLVVKENKPPVMVLLAPSIEPDYECLLEVQLPFAEDVRTYRFPPLDKVITVSGKVVTEHRNLPNKDLLDAMSEYVDSMELVDTDETGNPVEGLPIDDSFSPVLHRIDSAIRYRAIHPDDPVLPPSKNLTKLSQPPQDLVEKSKAYLQKLMEAADVKKVPPKVKGRKRIRESEKPLSGLDVDALLHQEKRARISPTNAIPEFKQTLTQAETIETIKDAVKQMTSIIEDQIKNSLGDANYDRVIEEMGVMREELISFEEPALYNNFLRQLKDKLLKEELGGDRRELWWLLRRSQLGLINQRESDQSDVTEEQAKEVSLRCHLSSRGIY
ncbi:ATP-dependent DNA helicase II subunit 2 [Aspergillus fumigatus]|nr:ATP-dependent DNA helicase II subunit 2 [Aspergillus fumigatus]KAH1388545.1 ATP-dependent DNA helicase II subunit 2 [Aspergillus fumigatus]KAH1496060.1 ATP-dependent DNA helicase II subunit 2 [Aspergillus fumigatus]KAH1687356.1 ATP-dependent DNA helicase II subunit 2 [Aspergillus fumigatus]KAH1708846.1 ATP-dependent DNA helicase II subunit 2 [Aspergillus fumigatus]